MNKLLLLQRMTFSLPRKSEEFVLVVDKLNVLVEESEEQQRETVQREKKAVIQVDTDIPPRF
jgi:hypothetical protein